MLMKLIPWNLDAYRAYKTGVTEDQLLLNQPIRDFLEDENKFFLIGAKGLGKTIFLRYKSYLFHGKYGDSIRFNESNTELTENLNIHPDTFSKEELLQFKDLELWVLLWELALWAMMFRICKLPVSPALEKIINKSTDLGAILTRLLNNRKKIEHYRTFATEFQERKREIQSGVSIFIDDTDQALHNFLLQPHRTDQYFEGPESPSVTVWINAQIGLINAIYNLNRQNGHVKIYAAIRREAWEAWESEIKINHEQHACLLDYDKGEIRSIFEKNLHLLEPADLTDRRPDASPMQKFMGFEEMEHPFAKDSAGNSRREAAFDFIYRHTYGRPREIVLIGRRIHEKIVSDDYRQATQAERVEKIRVLVNRVSDDLFAQYKQEIVPYLDEEHLQQFLKKVRSNVITKDDGHVLNPDTIRDYIRFGLIGRVRATNREGAMYQFFNPPAKYNYRKKQSLPDYDYLVVHSSMNTLLLEKHMFGNFYNKYNIIGDGYEFFPKTDHHVQRINYYLPQSISGNRMEARNENGGHATFPLKDIYQNFFTFDQYPQRYERLMANWNSAKTILGLLGRICYCHRLERAFQHGGYQRKQEEYLNELGNHHVARNYGTHLPDSHSPESLNRFLDRLVGRFIALGCYLVLDMRIEWIHQLLNEGRFSFNKSNPNRDTAFSYLNRNFFMEGLLKQEPRDPANSSHLAQKQRIFNALSEFEQASIRSFIETTCDEVHYLSWIDRPEEKKWLLDKAIGRTWRPE